MTASSALCDQARTIFVKALEASRVDSAFARKLSTREIDGLPHLSFQNPGEDAASPDPSHAVPLHHLRHLRIVAAGKASAEMLRALLTHLQLPSACSVQGVLIARERPADLPPHFQFFAGGHPMPTQGSFDGARAALNLFGQSPPASTTGAGTLCLFLVSGGASAMMELPLDPDVSLEDTVAFHRALVHSGASITEINCVRKHFSAIKGGRLALAAGKHPCLTLLVSDVPPGQLDALSSGPTLPDSSTVAQCLQILERYHLLDHFPATIRSFFESPSPPETPKPADLHAPAWTLLDSADLAATAQTEAERLGFGAIIDNTCDDWDYKDAAQYLLNRLRDLRRTHPGQPVCLLSSGEVTVQVSAAPHTGGSSSEEKKEKKEKEEKPHGTGGRNQQIAVHLATLLKASDAPIAILSAGSDGIDGNSDAAGAVLDHTTFGPDLAPALDALARFDTTPLLTARGATIMTGPTGNNLRDLRILLAR